MKSANWISATGRRPWSAMPIAVPMMPDSASGVSITRSSPNSSRNPAVALNTPPRAPTSSPRTTTRSSAFISSQSVSWTVWMMFFSVMPAFADAASPAAVSVAVSAIPTARDRLRVRLREHVPVRAVRFGVRRVPRRVDIRVDRRLQLGARGFEPCVVDEALFGQVGREEQDRVVGLRLLDLLTRAVGPVVVVGCVREVPVRLELDQRGPPAGAGLLDGVPGRRVASERVVAVGDHALEPVRLRP